MLSRCRIYEKLYLQDTDASRSEADDALEDCLISTYSSVLGMLYYLTILASSRSVNRAVHAVFNPNEFSAEVSALETWERRIEGEVSNCERGRRRLLDNETRIQHSVLHGLLNSHVARLEDGMENFWRKCNEDERMEILQWISDIQYDTDHYNARSGRTDGTGIWLTDDETYRDWRSTSASISLWLHGIRKFHHDGIATAGGYYMTNGTVSYSSWRWKNKIVYKRGR
jgi:ankyrin repeat domain-containing protein 50